MATIERHVTNALVALDALTPCREAANVMRRRIDPQGTLQPEVRTSPSDDTIEIALPGVKNPNAVGPGNQDPEELLAKYKTLLDDLSQTRAKLKKELMD